MKQAERMKQIERKTLGVDDAEAYSGLSKWTLRRKAYAGEIASIKVGKRLLIPIAEIDRLLAEGYRPALNDGNGHK